MSQALEDALREVLAHDEKHGRLLAALSHLEYVGARKIAKALPAKHASLDHLEHLMEESRHAALLRAQAERFHPEGGAGEEGRRAEAYLQNVDHGIDQLLRKTFGDYRAFETYLVVSLIIEERAMEFYPLYHRVLPEGPIKNAVGSILKDEVGHLEDMRGQCEALLAEHPTLLAACRALEREAYEEYFWPVLRKLSETACAAEKDL